MKFFSIGELSTVVRGSSPRPKGDTRYYGGEVPRLMVSDVSRDGMYVTPKIDSLTTEGAKKSRPMMKGDFVIAVSGDPGEPCILNVDACIHDGFVGLRNINKKLIFIPYLYHYFKYIKNNNQSQAVGAIYKNLNTDQIKNLKIPLPPLETQKKIAAILDEADKLRQLNQQLIEKYDALTQSLFLEMFGDLVNNQKGWDKVNFGTIFNSLRYGASTPPIYQNDGIPFIRATNIKNGNVEIKGMAYISKVEASKIEKCKLNEGDLIIVRSGANTGDCCRIPKRYQDSYGGFDIIISIDEPYSTFYNFLLNTKGGKAVLDPLTRRAGQPHLNSRQITDLQVFKPPRELQSQFAERLQAIEQQKTQAQSSLQKSEALFQSLLQRAFKGELV